jgi:hypothetical protein
VTVGGSISTRARLVQKAKAAFARRGVRWHMTLFVLGTAGAGMVASWAMLSVGLHIIWLRYVLATGFAYAAFLLFVRWWIRLTGADGAVSTDVEEEVFGNALDFAAGVADGIDLSDISVPSDGPSFELPDVGIDVDADDAAPLVLIVILCALAIGGLIAAGFLVWAAPTFFAEVFVDAALSYGLYRRLSSVEKHDWLQDAVKRTWLPFLVVALLLGAAGFAIHFFMPTADSIGDVF